MKPRPPSLPGFARLPQVARVRTFRAQSIIMLLPYLDMGLLGRNGGPFQTSGVCNVQSDEINRPTPRPTTVLRARRCLSGDSDRLA